ncbi:Ig-like domain-containing protein [Salinisphaera sp. T31B1]|uniref:Ig-like domain-containing protein n=1 Tax=Salinisphaera sp. T31B1 TaxID=727963 RepID=UPI00333FBC74
MSACSSGGGGDNGSANPRGDVTPQGLAFSYPFNGQQDVVLDSQMVVTFDGSVSGGTENALELQVDGQTAQPGITVEKDDDQPNILRLTPNGDLLPNTTYSVVATRSISGGNTAFNDGQTLLQFTTRPIEGRPAAGDFQVVETTPGEINPVTGRQSVFTQFNAIRVRLNEPVDPATVNADTFTVTGPDGKVTDARITALGRYLVFDPTEDLAPGTYTIALSGDVTSQFGKSLDSYSVERKVLSAGNVIPQTLALTPSADSIDDLPDNNLNGLAVNNVNISSQLIGSNDQPASASPQRGGVETILAQPGMSGFGDTIPATIRGGQKFQLTGLRLFLNGDVETPINPSGPIDVNFINDVDVYLMANDYRNIETPTAVRLRFDLGIGTLITAMAGQPGSDAFRQFVIQSLANGVFNQSALNIQASGLAIPQDNGDLRISTLGTFPINVNRTDDATVDFELTLTLAADSNDQPELEDDVVAPIVTAQSPSACLYVFGSPAYNATFAQTGSSPIAFPEQVCNQVLNSGGLTPPFVNSFPIESSPAITFSEPLDPQSVNAASIQLASSNGVVDATYRVEGFSVVIDPTAPLDPATNYSIRLNNSDTLKDLAGNPVSFENAFGPGQTIAFRTEPQVATDPTPPLLGTLTPGIPCALEGGDFTSGGDNAGHCSGDMPGTDDDGNSLPSEDFAVFQNPANVAVDAFFSKLVASDSIVLANGCLTSGSGDANTETSATVAVQQMDGSGQCVGAVDGEIALANRDGDFTRGFSFRPAQPFEAGMRYWIVVCGTDGSSCSNQIVDGNGDALNTDPLNGTGSTPQSMGQANAGGPDIVIPFDAVDATDDYYANQFTLPESDTNGNGQFDDGEVAQPGNRTRIALSASLLGQTIPITGEQPDGSFGSYLSLARPIAIRDTLDDCSVLDDVTNDDGSSAIGNTPDECIRVSLLPGGINSLTSINISADALAQALTTALGVNQLTGLLDQLLNGGMDGSTPTGNLDNVTGPLNQIVGAVTGVVGGLLGDGEDSDQSPAPIDVIAGLQGNELTAPLGNTLAGLINSDTPVSDVPGLLQNLVDQLVGTLTAGLLGDEPLQTGRVLLRFPNDDNTDGTQSGYIVEKCEGSINGQPYDFEPCFTASLTLVANAPDGQGVALNQQPITVNLVGPVTFEQNGRLAIALNNVNTFQLNATALSLLPATATVDPGDLNFQLVGSPTHGGREFPDR